ncbi:MAG: lipopolysaccharide heptosyltransferase I [Acidobacteria bacterium]|nr:lipopolysaccharide heptosyltransferase I [Acidobacteriota bacterium]
MTHAPAPPSRLVIVRLSSMGDIVHALPLAENAHRAGISVGWVVEKTYAGLLESNPAISAVFPADTRRWRRAPLSARSRGEIRRLRGAFRSFGADAVIDAQGLWKSALLARLAGAPVVSLGAADRRERTSSLLVDRPVALDPGVEHVVDQNLSLLGPLHIPAAVRAPDARYLLSVAREDADRLASGLQRPFALFHPGATRTEKAWGEAEYASLALELSERAGLFPVISWGPGDETRAGRLAKLLPDAPRLPLLDFAGLAHVAAHAALFVGGDTGPVHLADALGTPTLALFSPSSRRNIPARNRPYNGTWLSYDQASEIEAVVTKAISAARCAAP